MRIQDPQTNRYVIGVTIFHWNSTTKIQEVLLGSILEGVCVHGECEVGVGLVNIFQLFYGQVSELILERGRKKIRKEVLLQRLFLLREIGEKTLEKAEI